MVQITIESLEDGNNGKETKSYLKEMKFFFLFNWIIGYFPFSFDKHLLFIKFSWISWTTLTSLFRIVIIITIYAFGYRSYYIQFMSKNITTSSVYEIIMGNEFIFT